MTFARFVRSFALGLTLLIGPFAGLAQPVSVLAANQLPECRYDNIKTSPRAYSDWRITLLDTIYKVPRSYVPPKLVSTSKAGLNAGGKVRRLVISDLTALARAARKADSAVRVVSAYRSYRAQKRVYRREVERYGVKAARLTVARPGHSEHQLGTTIDFGSANSNKQAWQYDDWADTAAGHWMLKNAWKYGFILSYPRHRRSVTCYRYEPWHYRYVGRDLAAKVHYSGRTLREYLWNHFQ